MIACADIHGTLNSMDGHYERYICFYDGSYTDLDDFLFYSEVRFFILIEWKYLRDFFEHIISTVISRLFNIFCCGFYRRMMFPKSGFLGRCGKRKFH